MYFDYLDQATDFKKLAKYCKMAEESALTQPDFCAILARNALECLIKNFYRIKYPDMYIDDSLYALITNPYFSNYMDDIMLSSIHYIRKLGNAFAHGETVESKQAVLSVETLSYVVGEILMYFGAIESYPQFDRSLLEKKEKVLKPEQKVEVDENVLKYSSTVKSGKAHNPQDLSEIQTRKLYIDLALNEAGWSVNKTNGAIKAGQACIEIKVKGMPNSQWVGYVDYVLYDDDNKPLAVIEAKKTSVDPHVGCQQAKLYAQCLKTQFGYEPVIFFTNGYDFYLIDGVGGPERKVYGFYNKEELHSLIIRRSIMKIEDTTINPMISDRYFIQTAATNVCESFNNFRRKVLIVMATGTGKTRCAISIVDLLQKASWVKRILFLADRTALVDQAKNAFNNFLPSSTLSVLSDNKTERNLNAKVILSTYQTIINMIDCENKQFGIGAFDLIVVDECHRSIYNKYKAIFTYFDSLILGLTATPREQIDSSTYDVFDLPEGEPTFSYDYDTAVREKFLVNFHAFQRTTNILKNGLKYKDLNDSEKEQFENLFEDENGNIPESITGKMFYSQIMNLNTIDLVIKTVMKEGMRINSGENLGKTIIFAANHNHAKEIVDRFNKLYPEKGPNYCVLIDNQVKYAQSLIHKFEIKDGEPVIAVSVDMLDTGIDVPEVVNLVFFKRVYSKIKFWQMIGRGTRTCKGLNVFSPNKDFFNGNSDETYIEFDNHEDKVGFYIFDFCDVFEFFDLNPDGRPMKSSKNLSQKIFELKLDITHELQKYEHQTNEEHKDYYLKTRDELHNMVANLNRNLINVKNSLEVVDKYSLETSWESLSDFDVKNIKNNITSLIDPLSGDEDSKVFDLWLFNMEFCEILGDKDYSKAISKVVSVGEALLNKLTIPAVKEKQEFIQEVVSSDFWTAISISKLEKVRIELRDLVKFLIATPQPIKKSNFIDYVIEKVGGEKVVVSFKNYKQKVLDYLLEHSDSTMVRKIKNIEPLTSEDISNLEHVLCHDLGTVDDYENEAKGLSVGVYIRQMIGMDNDVINEKLSKWFSEYHFNAQQQEFIQEVVNFVRQNGDINYNDLNYSKPFDQYDFTEIFNDTNPLYNIVGMFHNTVCPVTA